MKVPDKSPAKATLRKRVSRVPTDPGVYRWIDKDGHLLYIGKAKNLRKRMLSYVNARAKNSAWTEMMVRQIADFEVTVVRSELEAFILESNLIKELKPKYNIMLKDDKGYVYVRISTEQFPTIDILRRMEKDKAKYFGPFTSGSKLTEQTLSMLDQLVRFRACRASLDRLNRSDGSDRGTSFVNDVPCLDQQIGKCNGLCIGALSGDEYRSRIAEVEQFFRGQYSPLKKRAEQQMKELAAQEKFERAARVRDVLRFIDDLEKKQIISDATGDNADVFGIAFQHGKIHVMLLKQRDGKLIGQASFALKGEAENKADALAEFLPQYYEDTHDIPDTIIVSDLLLDGELLTTWLSTRRGKDVRILVPERGKKSKLLEMAERNAEEKVEQQFAVWEAESKSVESALNELASLLHLSSPPRRIEGYDISHLGGSETVGSMVVMINGKPKREHYRSFNMKTLADGEIDDYRALRETLLRRLRYLSAGVPQQRSWWKSQGVTIGKARKAEQPILEKIVAQNPGTLGPEIIDYHRYIVARDASSDIVACAALFEDKVKLIEIDPVWVSEKYRGKKLGLLLVQIFLHKQKKKVYLLCKPALEDYYASIGFRAVHDVPDYLKQKVQDFVERYQQPAEIVMMIEPKKNKPDTSFSDRPDLLLIDGGKGQLSTIIDVLKELSLDIPLASLAKREEELFIPSEPLPLPVPKDSSARFLLQRLRDEAHRFANDRRKRRQKTAMFHSKLDDVSGIGEILKAKLLKAFGSADFVIAATDKELLTILNSSQLSELRKLFPRPMP